MSALEYYQAELASYSYHSLIEIERDLRRQIEGGANSISRMAEFMISAQEVLL